MHEASHQLRCVGCSAVILPDTVEKDFRCVDCAELLEVEYPSWSEAGAPFASPRRMPNPGALRWLWQERLQSRVPIDQSGVWRFRELLPILVHPEQAVGFRRASVPRSRSATAPAPALRRCGARRLCHTLAVTTIWSFSLSGASRHHTRGSVR